MESLNLSWNNIQNSKNAKNSDLNDEELESIENFGKFIKHNTHLQELKMTHAQMGDCFLKALMKHISKAPSLQVFDISGNPGINSDVRNLISKKLKCQEQQTSFEIIHKANLLSKNLMKLNELPRKRKI